MLPVRNPLVTCKISISTQQYEVGSYKPSLHVHLEREHKLCRARRELLESEATSFVRTGDDHGLRHLKNLHPYTSGCSPHLQHPPSSPSHHCHTAHFPSGSISKLPLLSICRFSAFLLSNYNRIAGRFVRRDAPGSQLNATSLCLLKQIDFH